VPWGGSEAGSYLRLIDFVYHSTLGLRVIKKNKGGGDAAFCLSAWRLEVGDWRSKGPLAHKKMRPPRTLQEDSA